MSSCRNPGWRKPVPKLLPEVPPYSPLETPSQTAPHYAAHRLVVEEKPPLPPKWDPTVERVLRNSSKRNAVYVPSSSDTDKSFDTDNSSPPVQILLRQQGRPRAPMPRAMASRHASVRRSHLAQALNINHEQIPHHPMPQNYRPPTPPQPSKRQKLVEKSSIRVQQGALEKVGHRDTSWAFVDSENVPIDPPSYAYAVLPPSKDYATFHPLHADDALGEECWELPHLLNHFSTDAPAYKKSSRPPAGGKGHLLGSVRMFGGCLRNKLSDALMLKGDLCLARSQKA